MKHGLTAAVITKDAEATLEETLKSLTFASHILIVDQNSSDKTIDIALRYTADIYSSSEPSFARRRDLALKNCRTDWIFYIDSDEVVTKKLADEIKEVTQNSQPGVFSVVRQNYFLDREMYPDKVERLFHLDLIRGWEGKVHESPVTTKPAVTLTNHLIHKTHRDITSMLNKTNEWSETEAQLRVEAKHPPMAGWRLFRIAVSELGHQLIKLKVWRYGRPGWFEGYFQMIDKLIVYTKLWEKQH